MSTPLLPSALMSPLFSSAAMREILSDNARLNRMLRAEAALAAAEASHRRDPERRGQADRRGLPGEILRHRRAGLAAVSAGNLAIPLVKALTAEVAKKDAEAARYVHWGATSQDIIDTALVLELRAVIDDLTHRTRSRDPGLHHARREAPAYGDGRAHLAAAGSADAVRAESRGLCGGADPLARAAEAGAQRGAGAAIRRRHRHARGARRPRARRRHRLRQGTRPAAAGRTVAYPQGPARRSRELRSRSSPAPAARSRAMSRC